MNNNGINTFVWLEGGQQSHIEKSYVDDNFSYFYPFKHIPRFQLRRGNSVVDNPDPPTAQQITSFKLIRCEDGVELDIIGSMNSEHGLHALEYSGYDLIINPSTTSLLFPATYEAKEGSHYCEMSDGTNTWKSERFVWRLDMSDFLKITYWHDEGFMLPNSHVRYAPPYKNVLYLQTEVGKPQYPTREDVQNRGGYFFPVFQESSKEFRFSIHGPEHLLDGMSRIWQHRHLKIESKNKVYYPSRFLMSQPNWENKGDVASVDFSFFTDTVTVVVGTGKIPGQGDFDGTDYNEDFLNEINS